MAKKALKFLVTLLVIGVIYYLLMWTLGAVGLGDPFAKIGRIVVIVAAVAALINAILALFDKAWFDW